MTIKFGCVEAVARALCPAPDKNVHPPTLYYEDGSLVRGLDTTRRVKWWTLFVQDAEKAIIALEAWRWRE